MYFLFLEDAIRFYPYLIKNKSDFAFTLYPGGGFLLENPVIDSKIQHIVNSQYCKGVFVNGSFAYQYLTTKLNIAKDKVHLAHGVPLTFDPNIEVLEKDDKFTIGFSARKYMKRGSDKGFDVFAQVALALADFHDIQFVCIGDFTENDLLQEEKQKANIEFKGLIKGTDYHVQLSQLDLIISPVKCMLNNGDFDGFPTSSVVESSMLGVTMICSDPMNDNLYKDGEEIIILPSDVDSYKEQILELYQNRSLSTQIGKRGMLKTRKLYSLDNTLKVKINKLAQWLKA